MLEIKFKQLLKRYSFQKTTIKKPLERDSISHKKV